jgi:hypothetical protein
MRSCQLGEKFNSILFPSLEFSVDDIFRAP